MPGLLGESGSRAVRLDGSNDYVSVPNATSLALGSAFSLEAWVSPAFLPAAGSFASVLSKPEAYSLQFNGAQMEFTVIQSGSRKRLQAAPGAVPANAVSHVVGTYDGGTQRLYINGVEVANRTQTGAASTVGNGLNIGSWNGAGEFMGGLVDEVAVYRAPLSAAQVKAHYDAGRGATTSTASVRGFGLSRPQPRRVTKPAQAKTQRIALRKAPRVTWTERASLEPLCHLEVRDKRRLEG